MKYNYGEKVRVIRSAPSELKPGQLGWVVGYWTISTSELAIEFNQEIGSGIYTIEFEDKPSGIEIPEMFIIGRGDAESN
jgi:hypothetical protein